ncbi:MAG: DNA-binding response regulator [Firmicutes bacterium HGW-Firmicutes-7]|nr:MAG: DNA-binding response regulator [Firmicutes bacterium HGW-Firmicutes-7]
MLHTILVVEDDPTINEVVSEYLKDAGFIVITANNGKTAHSFIIQNQQIHLFILDIMLPQVSGLELLKIIRAEEVYKNTPIMMLTALSDENAQLISFEGLADDYVTKPFSPKVLVKRVEALLRRSNEGTSNIIQIGSINVDIDSYEVFEDGNKVVLTLKEFEIFKVLINNERKVITRQQLLNFVWGYDYFGDERIVDVHIKNLRKKLKTDLITTVKGVGYKIETAKGVN